MPKKQFNISDWLPSDISNNKTNSISLNPSKKSSLNIANTSSSSMTENKPSKITGSRSSSGVEMSEVDKRLLSEVDIRLLSEVEAIVQQIESQQFDLTSTYSDWLEIGFALSTEFGESGRDYYHRISHFHPAYNQKDCDNQYTNCLKSKGHGINIQTFFYKAKVAGININYPKKKPSTSVLPCGNSEQSKNQALLNTPQLPSSIYKKLPQFLTDCTNMFKGSIEKDVFLIGALSVLSGCFPNIQGYYFNEPVSPHLYSFITAPAGSGKGKLKWTKYLGLAIHKEMVRISNIEKEKYESDLEYYSNLSKNHRASKAKPKEPKCKMFYIPANSSSSAFIQALADNDFKGIIFETEADTLSNTLKQDWGNFSDVLRKAFHHESTNMFRRKDNEYIEVEDPHLAITLSGTPKQLHTMMPDVENGLFSRFLYYAFEDYSNFKNPFITNGSTDFTSFFKKQGSQIFELYHELNKFQNPLVFSLTKNQANDFTNQFDEICKRNLLLLGNDFNANSRRLGLIAFRIAMILSALRILETGDTSCTLICSDIDFETALTIVKTLEKHAAKVFQNLPNNKLKGIKLNFFNELPHQFNRQQYLKTALSLQIKEKTAEKYISQFRNTSILRHEHNRYTKI